jgi:lysozyme
MEISQNCLDIIEKWEGFFLDAYLDPVGIPTIGYGTIRYPNGVKVRMGDKITKAEAEAFLKFECDEIVNSLESLLAGITLNQNQFDAVVSLCYNSGVGAFAESTVLRELKAGKFGEASNAFDLWVKGEVGGVLQTLPGLVNRRNDEQGLFNKVGTEGTPIKVESSPQSKVTWLEGYRDGSNNVIVAWEGSSVVEILVLKSALKEDLIAVLQQYKNAQNFHFAPPSKAIPTGDRIEVSGKGQEIAKVATRPSLERSLLVIGVRDNDPGVSGSDVKELQQRLNDLGYYSGKVDGIFGKGTDDAVKKFQADHFGIAEADGKVGATTWKKLWGSDTPVPSLSGGISSPGLNYLRLTKTSIKDPFGLFKLKLEYFKNGLSNDFIEVCSGQPTRQFFRKGSDSEAGSFEPLPEGKWAIQDIVWAGGKDNYSGAVFDSGLGPVSVPLDYAGPSVTGRSAIEIHIDWNRDTSPGTAGCIGINNISDYKRFVSWLRDTDPSALYVDWGLGSVPSPK